MKKRYIIWISFCFALVLANGCLDPYNPSVTTNNVEYLVVEGNFNANGTTTVQLSRTTPIGDDTVAIEPNATVEIEGDDGTHLGLVNVSAGTYTLPPVTIDSTRKFRLKITTVENKSYVSDFVPYKQTPAIDTITYSITGNDLQIYLSAHSEQGNARYYLWKYAETWAYQSRYPSEYIYQDGTIVPRPDRNELFYCWRTIHSSQILIGSSAQLEQDIIHDFPLHKLEVNGEQFQSKYSILVEQYTLTAEAYAYWQEIKKSTESIGTIFDPQPSQASSNIHDVTNPEVPVVGFFTAGSIRQQRIFIKKDDLPTVDRHTFYDDCVIIFLPLDQVPNYTGNSLIFTADYSRGGQLTGYETTTPACIDCRMHGGTTVKPDFW